MVKNCPNCNKSFKGSEEIKLCPYCGFSYEISKIGIESLVESIDYTFGNQAKYAEKLKEVFKNHKKKLMASYLTQQKIAKNRVFPIEEEKKQEDVQKSSKKILHKSFSDLILSTKLEEIQKNYIKLIGDIKYLANFEYKDENIQDEVELQKIEEKENKLLKQIYLISSNIIDELFSLEKQCGIYSDFNADLKINKVISNSIDNQNSKELNFNDSLENKTINSDLVANVIDQINIGFKNIISIIKFQGIIAYTNNNFEIGEIDHLSEYLEGSIGSKVKLEIALNHLIASNEKNYSDIFNEEFETHLLIFFETVWLFVDYLSSFKNKKQERIFNIVTNLPNQLDRWYENITISVDFNKCKKEFDMLGIYVLTRDQSEANIARLEEIVEVEHEFY